MEKIIVLTGGGTGGHVIPNLSLIPYLKKHFDKIYYLGTNGIEKELTKGKVDQFFEIEACKFDREHIFKNALLPFKMLKNVHMCKCILQKIKPDIIFAKGGYVSLPVCIAGRKLKIPIVAHESDLSIGKANKIICRLSKKFCTTFEKTAESLPKGVFTGSPIRKELFLGDIEKGKKMTGFDLSREVVMFVGGSTGAKALNEIVWSSLDALTQKYDVIHLTGKGKNMQKKVPHYYQAEFCRNIQDLLKISSVVVSRAGSNAIYEFLALNKPMLLVPLPKGNSRGDQVENAKYFEEKGFAKVLYQENLSKENLLKSIEQMLKEKDAIKQNLSSQDKAKLTHGAENITKEILKVIEN